MGILAGKAAVVTGGGTGIGEGIARRFAEEGCQVVVSGRRRAEIDRVAAAIGGLAVAGDVSIEADVAALMAACESAFGRLDILVNNAGIGGPTAAVEEMDLAAWDQVFAINVRGLMLCTKHAVPLLSRQGGAVVNIASRVAFRPFSHRSAYGASKFAVRGITEATALELGPLGIRVNCLAPGAVDTELFRANAAGRAALRGVDLDTYIKTTFVDEAALRRLVRVEDVANAALFLASDAAAAITGEAIKIDGGRP